MKQKTKQKPRPTTKPKSMPKTKSKAKNPWMKLGIALTLAGALFFGGWIVYKPVTNYLNISIIRPVQNWISGGALDRAEEAEAELAQGTAEEAQTQLTAALAAQAAAEAQLALEEAARILAEAELDATLAQLAYEAAELQMAQEEVVNLQNALENIPPVKEMLAVTAVAAYRGFEFEQAKMRSIRYAVNGQNLGSYVWGGSGSAAYQENISVGTTMFRTIEKINNYLGESVEHPALGSSFHFSLLAPILGSYSIGLTGEHILSAVTEGSDYIYSITYIFDDARWQAEYLQSLLEPEEEILGPLVVHNMLIREYSTITGGEYFAWENEILRGLGPDTYMPLGLYDLPEAHSINPELFIHELARIIHIDILYNFFAYGQLLYNDYSLWGEDPLFISGQGDIFNLDQGYTFEDTILSRDAFQSYFYNLVFNTQDDSVTLHQNNLYAYGDAKVTADFYLSIPLLEIRDIMSERYA